MLDFYILDDDQPIPEEIDTLKLAGSLDLVVFQRWKKIILIDQRFDYFSDFRCDTLTVKLLINECENILVAGNTDVRLLHGILQKALTHGSGLVALAD